MWYFLDEISKEPIPIDDITKIEDSFIESIANDTIIDKKGNQVKISTVFLAIDHGISPVNKKPILFETMVFNSTDSELQYRYTNYNKAMEGHALVIKYIKEEININELEEQMNLLQSY